MLPILTPQSVDTIAFVVGVIIALCGSCLLAYPLYRPETRRRERIVIDCVNREGKKQGLKGQYRLRFERWSTFSSLGGSSYTPSDKLDKSLFDSIGGKLEGEAIIRANKMFWTDGRLYLLGLGLLISGTTISATATVGWLP